MVTTSSGECEFKAGEGAWDITPTSTEGSRRANYPISEVWCSDNKYQCIDIEKSFNLDWFLCKKLNKFNWRASLVPAAAVCQAPVVYVVFDGVRLFFFFFNLYFSYNLMLWCINYLFVYQLIHFSFQLISLYWMSLVIYFVINIFLKELGVNPLSCNYCIQNWGNQIILLDQQNLSSVYLW